MLPKLKVPLSGLKGVELTILRNDDQCLKTTIKTDKKGKFIGYDYYAEDYMQCVNQEILYCLSEEGYSRIEAFSEKVIKVYNESCN